MLKFFRPRVKLTGSFPFPLNTVMVFNRTEFTPDTKVFSLMMKVKDSVWLAKGIGEMDNFELIAKIPLTGDESQHKWEFEGTALTSVLASEVSTCAYRGEEEGVQSFEKKNIIRRIF